MGKTRRQKRLVSAWQSQRRHDALAVLRPGGHETADPVGVDRAAEMVVPASKQPRGDGADRATLRWPAI